MSHALLDRLAEAPLLVDGAMGTPHELESRVREINRAGARAAGDRGLRVGIEAAQALLAEVRRRHAGAYLMPSFGRFEVVVEVLEALDLRRHHPAVLEEVRCVSS